MFKQCNTINKTLKFDKSTNKKHCISAKNKTYVHGSNNIVDLFHCNAMLMIQVTFIAINIQTINI